MEKNSVSTKILNESLLVFSQKGIKSVSMQDIANSLGISKKTVYSFYENKETLLEQCVDKILENIKNKCKLAEESGSNQIRIIIDINRIFEDYMDTLSVVFFSDLKKYYHKLYDKFSLFKNDFMTNFVSNLLQKGIMQGLFRKDLKVSEIAGIYTLQIDRHYLTATESDFKSFFNVFNDLFLYGITSNAGRQVLHASKFD